MMSLAVEALAIGLTTGAVYAFIAIGFNLVFGVLNVFNFAHGAIMMVGTYAALYSFFLLTDSFWLACLMGVIGAAAVGLAIERFAVRPLKGNQWTTAVATVGCAFFLENIVSYVTNPRPESFPRPFENVTYYRVVGDAEVSNLQILLVILSFFLMVGVVLFLSRTALGKAIRVLGQSQDIAQCVGIDTRWVTMYTFALSGALGGVAGMINSVTFGSTEPYIGTFFGLKGIVVIIVAGVGNMRGALAVGVLLGLLESFVVIFGEATYRDIIAYLSLILILLFRPTGLFGHEARTGRAV